ncbi:hypothetical protein [Mycobacteroides abscessus]|uniref:hypothetical protein n=1 Tax=Mycobacteroides abscessus TaxID=36809 RepID=UPI0012E95252|nr:hypothetical protein [Mycobacteroides abscessus]
MSASSFVVTSWHEPVLLALSWRRRAHDLSSVLALWSLQGSHAARRFLGSNARSGRRDAGCSLSTTVALPVQMPSYWMRQR